MKIKLKIIKAIGWYYSAKKLVWCSWRHQPDRCYPTVWSEQFAKDNGMKWEPDYWHCRRCSSCGVGMVAMGIAQTRSKDPLWAKLLHRIPIDNAQSIRQGG